MAEITDEQLAQMLSEMRNETDARLFQYLVDHLCVSFASKNEQFDEELFVEMCYR